MRTVRVATDDEIKRYDRHQKELDDCCHKIISYIIICFMTSICIYFIMILILSMIYDYNHISSNNRVLIVEEYILNKDGSY
jgi:hypothetical protein